VTRRRVLLLVGSVFLLLVGVIIVRTLRQDSAPATVEPAAEVAIPAGAAERLAGSIRIPTVSHDDPAAYCLWSLASAFWRPVSLTSLIGDRVGTEPVPPNKRMQLTRASGLRNVG
jgi:hypothetical protein